MSDRKPSQTALQKMQDIANRLISNTPELSKILQQGSALKPKKSFSPTSKKNPVTKNAAMFTLLNKNQMTSNDYYERCKELASELQTSRDKIFSLEEEIITIKQRFVEREIQYRKIIEELQDEIKSKTSLDSTDRNRMTQINDLHKEIIDNIGTIQNKTSKILIEQQSDIRRFFHKQINQIKEKFKEDKINKTQKDQEYIEKEKQMMSELEWIKNIAHKIDLENQTLMKKYTTLKSEYEIQEKDKDLLMKELLMKKKQNAILKSQVEQYEKLLNEVSKQMQQNQTRNNQSTDNFIGEVEGISRINTKGGISMVKGSYRNDNNTMNSRVSAGEVSSRNVGGQKYENSISHLNNVISKEKKKVRDLKNLYMKEIGSKSDLEKIIRKLVDDVRQSIVEIERERTRKKKGNEDMSQQSREKLLEQLLSNEKILTLIYDKTFYSGLKSASGFEKIPEQLAKILQSGNEEGFY